MIHIAKTPKGERLGMGVQSMRRGRAGLWEYSLGAAYASELTQAFPGSDARRIENIESLHRLGYSVEEGNSEAYLVEIVDKPGRIISLEVRYTPRILFPIEHITEFVLKDGGRSVEMMELLQDMGTWRSHEGSRSVGGGGT